MEKDRIRVYLAALLHDIGKFYQRADEGGVAKSSYLSRENKVESTYCPQFKGEYSHKHVLWTAQFFDTYSSVFNQLTKVKGDGELVRLAAQHHLQANQLGKLGQIIKRADHLSSGMDRESNSALRDSQDEELKGWDAFKRKRMVSILEGIGKFKEKEADQDLNHRFHMPVVRQALSKDVFPTTDDKLPDYKALWNQFDLEFRYIQAKSYETFSETLLYLMQKYLSCIPSSTIHFPDISLYDHSKTTAALAVCMYDYEKENDGKGVPFRLIGGDLSGIQNYLYQITSNHAGKNLKGRSFYLYLLMDSVVRVILDRLKLYRANVIYNSGGSFYILAPNTQFVNQELKQLLPEIEKQLFDAHGTSLFVALDSVELSENALMNSNGESLRKVWKELFDRRDRKKRSRFSTMIHTYYDLFFEPSRQSGAIQIDAISGEEFRGPNEKGVRFGDGLIRKITDQQIKLGEVLREAECFVISKEEIPQWRGSKVVQITPGELGYRYYFPKEKEIEEIKSVDGVTIITLNEKKGKDNFLKSDILGVDNLYGYHFYAGNEGTMVFEKMCKKRENGIERLGVLRMDVDNLGRIFQEGIPECRATLSRYATLSRSFDFFFTGYINTICQEIDKEHAFIVYAGGDDLFIVGDWQVALEIAERIKNDFAAFACANPAFSLSGGLALVKPKYPIMKAAEESHEEESRAKGHSCCEAEKNAISFMETPLNWNREYPQVKELKNAIVAARNEGLPSSFISKLLQHYENANIEKHQIGNLKTYWMISYDMARMKERYRAHSTLIDTFVKDIVQGTKTLLQKAIETEYHAFELWALAARWAELEVRKS